VSCEAGDIVWILPVKASNPFKASTFLPETQGNP
jgi:hypothetical protein